MEFRESNKIKSSKKERERKYGCNKKGIMRDVLGKGIIEDSLRRIHRHRRGV